MVPGAAADLGPVCPACGSDLRVLQAEVVDGDDLVQGALVCNGDDCQRLVPVVDGIPLLAPDLSALFGDGGFALAARDDLAPGVGQVLGEIAGSGSSWDVRRQNLSSYCWGHWRDHDPAETDAATPEIVRLLERGLEEVGDVAGPTLDLGCGVGRTVAVLAGAGLGPVVGVDLGIAFLRVAQRALRQGRVRYDLRRTGLVYERRDFAVPAASAQLWCADATALPVRPGSAGLVVSLNLLDCVASPLDHLRTIRDALRPGGRALIATPFDWSPSATPVEGWIGGHSPLADGAGQGGDLLVSLLGGDHRAALDEMRTVARVDGVPWRVRLHDRAVVLYDVTLVVAERTAEA